MSTCIVLANAAHWRMLIILHSNYLTIIAISLMIILFSPFVVVQCFSMVQAVRLGPPLHHPSVSKAHTKGSVIISLHHALGLPGILHTFKQKDVEEDAAALPLTPHMPCSEAACGNLSDNPVLTSPRTWSSNTVDYGRTAGNSVLATAQPEWDWLSNCSRTRTDLICFYSRERKRPDLPTSRA